MPASRWTTALAAALGALGLAATGTAHAATSADSYRDQLWGLDQIRAEQAWSTTTGEGAVVAVVDSGVDLGHPQLAGQLVPGATFSCAEGQPRPCGDGGWKGPDGVGQTPDRHGTHVAGTIAAAADGAGVVGVAPRAKIMPIKVLEDGTGSNADIADGIRFAADNDADVINLSLGSLPGTQIFSILGADTEMQEAIAYAREKGTLTIAAAGNTSTLLCNDPAFGSDAICVASSDRNKLKSYFSELPVSRNGKGVTAPGGAGLLGCRGDILSTVPVGTGNADECGDGDHDTMAGTSMATPHVAGVAGLLFGQGRDVDEVESAILRTARQPLTGIQGVFSPVYGWGIVDASAAVSAPRR